MDVGNSIREGYEVFDTTLPDMPTCSCNCVKINVYNKFVKNEGRYSRRKGIGKIYLSQREFGKND